MFIEDLDLKKEYIFIGFKELKSYFIKKKTLIPQLNFKYYSLEELQESVFGVSNLETIKESLKFLDDDYKLTKKFISYIKKGVNEEIDPRVKSLKENLIKNNLLKKDENFKQLFKNKEVYIIGYEEKNIELNHILDFLEIRNLKYLKLNEIFEEKDFYVTRFLRNDEEIRYAFIKITELLNNGTSPSDIKIITDINANYFYLRLFEKQFNLVLNYKEFKTLYDTKTSKIIERSLDTLTSANISSLDDGTEYFEDIKQILEFYDFYNLKNRKANFKSILSDYSINERLKTQSIEVSSSLNYVENKHIFILGFDSMFYSQVNKNNDYFDDELKEKNNLNSTTIKNIEGDSLYENFLNLNNTYYIYYHESDGSKKEISFYFKKRYDKVVDGVNLQASHILKPEILDVDYSKSLAKAYYSYYKDLKDKFFIRSEYYDLYKNNKEIKLDKYDPSYKRINRVDNETLCISYTPMNSFYECPFKYYCNYILKLDSFEESFQLIAGNILHAVFEKIYTSNESFDEIYDEVFKDYVGKFNDIELIILEKLKKIGRVIFNNLRNELKDNPNIIKTYSEGKIYSDLKDLNALVYAKIDSILLAKDAEENIYAQILDYKTGTVSLKQDHFVYGLNLQLPIYDYAVSNSNSKEFNGVNISGIYYVNFYTKHYANYYEDDFSKEFPNYLKEGLTIGNLASVQSFEPNIVKDKKSTTIKQLTTNGKTLSGASTGKANYNIPLEDENGNEISSMIKQIFEYFVKSNRNNNFKISPYYLDDDYGNGCKYCGFKDVCFIENKKVRDHKPLFKIEGIDEETKENKSNGKN